MMGLFTPAHVLLSLERGKPVRRTLTIENFKDHEDEGQWRSYDLETEGATLEECLENAVYWQTDQDGGSLGDIPADDDRAVAAIEKWWAK